MTTGDLTDLDNRVAALEAYIPPGGGLLVTAVGLQQLLQPVQDSATAANTAAGQAQDLATAVDTKATDNAGSITNLQTDAAQSSTDLQAALGAMNAATDQYDSLNSLISSEAAARQSADGANTGAVLSLQDLFNGVFRWTQDVTPTTALPDKLANSDGSWPLTPGAAYMYECEARTDAGADAVSQFTSDGTTWTVKKISESGTTGACPKFIVDADGEPAILPYNSTDPVHMLVQIERHNSQKTVGTINAAAIDSEAVIRQNADNQMASTIALVGAKNAGGTAFVLNQGTAMVDADTTLGQYISGVKAQTADAGNLVTKPTFDDGFIGPWDTGSGAIVAVTADPQMSNRKVLRIFASTYVDGADNYFPCKPGDVFDMECWASGFSLPAGASVYQQIQWVDENFTVLGAAGANGNVIATGAGGQTYARQTPAVAPAGAAYGRPGFTWSGTASSGSTQFALVSFVTIKKRTVLGNQTASAVTSLSASVDAVTGKVNASYTVSLDANGYVSGVVAQNNGATSSFAVVADKFSVIDPSGGASLTWQNGLLVNTNGAVMTVSGPGFGANGDLMEWFGPAMAVSQCTKANAITWKDTSGSAYFGGTLSAGTLYNAQQSTSVALNAQISIGPYATNGNVKTIVLSYAYSDHLNSSGSGTGSQATSASIDLYRTIGTGTETKVSTLNATGTWTWETESGTRTDSTAISGSMTFTDNVSGTDSRTYRAVLVSRNQGMAQTGNAVQKITLSSAEQ